MWSSLFILIAFVKRLIYNNEKYLSFVNVEGTRCIV